MPRNLALFLAVFGLGAATALLGGCDRLDKSKSFRALLAMAKGATGKTAVTRGTAASDRTSVSQRPGCFVKYWVARYSMFARPTGRMKGATSISTW